VSEKERGRAATAKIEWERKCERKRKKERNKERERE